VLAMVELSIMKKIHSFPSKQSASLAQMRQRQKDSACLQARSSLPRVKLEFKGRYRLVVVEYIRTGQHDGVSQIVAFVLVSLDSRALWQRHRRSYHCDSSDRSVATAPPT
jgi:hypothetical protein